MTKKHPNSLYVGASTIRALLKAEGVGAIKTLHAMFPNVEPKVLELMAKFPEEIKISGSQLILPNSWGNLD
jgi:hypothetical protein